MRLSALLSAIEDVEVGIARVGSDPDITDVVQHTAGIRAGALFCCVPGTLRDGHDLAPEAIGAGAAALLCDHELDLPAPQLLVRSVRPALGPTAAAFWEHPSRHLDVAGVTGTNGKTTVTHVLAAVLAAAGRSAEVIGTLSGIRSSGVPTTPEAAELQAQLASLLRSGVDSVAIEVSSHALAAHRVEATRFAVGVFTNLTPDHLDHHGDIEAYFEAKARLFEPRRCEVAVVNADDPYGRRLLADLSVPTVPYSLQDVDDVEIGRHGSRFTWRGREVAVPLVGEFNVSNSLAAALAAEQLGAGLDAVVAGMARVAPVPGRFERVERGQPFDVVVDYAHTPDSLRVALEAARAVATGSVTVVFGCGGERDTAKRPLMGGTAGLLADRVIVTSDNPRGEDPDEIIDAVLRGMSDPGSAVVEPDRRAAIELALAGARPGDVVLVAGKGHETVQVVAGREVPFDDRVVAAEVLDATGAAG